MSYSARVSPKTARRQRIIVVPRLPAYALTPRFAMSAVYRSLQTPPNQRSLLNVEAIYTYLKEWPVFTSIAKNERVQKDICKAIQLENYKDGELVYKLDDLCDGWYLIYSGNVILVEKCDKEPTDPDEILSNKYIRRIHNPVLRKQYFRIVRRATVSEDVGREEMLSNSYRKQFCIAVGETEVLRVDPYTFRFVLETINNLIVQERTALILNITKLEPLFDYPDILEYIAESLKDFEIEEGTLIDNSNPIHNGFILIKSGLIKVHRNIDFTKISVEPEKLHIGELDFEIPEGESTLVATTYGENTIFALPEVYTSKLYEFKASVVRKVKGMLLDYRDFFSLIPMVVQKEILKNILDQRDDQTVVNDYIENLRKHIWKSFRTKCLDEARDYNSVTRNSFKDEVLKRTPKMPNSIPTYRPRTYHSARLTI